MSYRAEPFTIEFATSLIVLDEGQSDVDIGALYTAIKSAQESEEGIQYGRIGKGSGLVDLGGGVQVGLTLELLGAWQLKFAGGNYVARVTGGNLVGGLDGDPIAYSVGVQTLLIQSAASTVVNVSGGGPTSGGGLTSAQAAMLTALAKIHGLVSGTPLVVSPTGRVAGDIEQSISESDGVVTVTRNA